MNKWILNCLTAVAVCVSASIVANQSIDRAVSNVIPFIDLSQENMRDFVNGTLTDAVLECPAGIKLPFEFTVEGDCLGLDGVESLRNIKILKSCFIKREGEEFLFSLDLQEWSTFQEFFTGMLGASLNINENGPVFGINIELNQRTTP